jgi:PAS domain S-box-containing protein
MRAINEGVYDWDVANGTIYYSEAVYSVLHMPRSVKTPGGWRKRIHPDDLAAYDAALVGHFKKKTRRFECDYRYRSRDRTWRWARQHGMAIRDKRGRVVRVIGSTGDITELKRVELALAESRERYALATWAATEGIYEWNLVTGSLFLSDRAKTFFGVKGDKLTPAAWNARVHRDDFPGYRAALADYFKARTPQFEHEYRSRNTAGGYSWVIDRAAAVRDAGGKVIRLVGALADVTQRKLAEIELRRARDEATEALERQTATAEILNVIARSPSEVQPVFDAIAANAMRLLGGRSSAVTRVVGDMLHLAAFTATTEAGNKALRSLFPRSVESAPGIWRMVIRSGKPESRIDVQSDPRATPEVKEMARARGFRSALAVPMLRDGVVIGAINITRSEPGPFTDHQINLLQTFADQAVIAIENVRLFNETRESLERQTATAEILKVIASSPSDVQPVFDAIAESALRLVGGRASAVTRVDGDMLRLVARSSTSEGGNEAIEKFFPRPVAEYGIFGEAVRTRAPAVRINTDGDEQLSDEAKGMARARGIRSVLVVPLLREGAAVGTISVAREEAGEFSAHRVNLLKTFADQAVIAIENVRLFNETKEALEQQRASAEVLGAISGSMADTQPVFGRIVESCERLFAGQLVGINVLGADGRLHLGAYRGKERKRFEKIYPLPADEGSGSGAAIVRGRVMHYADVDRDSSVPPSTRAGCATLGIKSVIFAPMLSEGSAIGAIFVGRRQIAPFSDKEIELLKGFASQAAISIKNVRLFNETKQALERQTATAEILRTIAGSPTDAQPVLEALAARAGQLSGAAYVNVLLEESGKLRTRAVFSAKGGPRADLAFTMPTSRATVNGRAFQERRVVQVEDFAAVAKKDYPDAVEFQRRFGFRTILGIPMLREGRAIGTLSVWRREVKPFTADEIALLQTFADQAVIAIENVRLFNETKEALERQTAVSEILRVISDSPGDVMPVMEAVAVRAARICDAKVVDIVLREGDSVRVAATYGELGRPLGMLVPLNRETVMGRSIVDGAPVQFDDLQKAPDEFRLGRELAIQYGHRPILAVPLMREGKALGTILVRRAEVRPFEERHIALLRTFADQAAIAIENARLFNETREALERQTATAEILKVISESPNDTQPVFDIIAERAARLTEASYAWVFTFDGTLIHVARVIGLNAEGVEAARKAFPMPPSGGSYTALAIRDAKVLNVADALAETDPEYATKTIAVAAGYRSVLAVPMFRGRQVVGAITVSRAQAGRFSDREVELLKTFADQAVIAIENVRLFNETKEALERQTATAEILNVIASSPQDVQPVFDAIAKSAYRLIGGFSTAVARVFDDVLHLVAFSSTDEAGNEALKSAFPMPVSRSNVDGHPELTHLRG